MPACKIGQTRAGTIVLLIVTTFWMVACTTYVEPPALIPDALPCHIIYDAGSSGTRLFIYRQTATGWLQHRGPKTAALADPVRENRGQSLSDAGTVVEAIVAALDDIRNDGPLNNEGQPEWPAFDWQRLCSVDSVAVYATAGMRLAERKDAEASQSVWNLLNDRLSAAMDMPVTTRTLSGFEEGLFAWLAVSAGQDDADFGVAGMGGASIQVTFPCSTCASARVVRVKNRLLSLYSYSLLDWGKDQAWERFGSAPACELGAGLNNPDWKSSDCAAVMGGFSDAAQAVGMSIKAAPGLRWYLSDAFIYMRDSDIDQYCLKGADSGFQPHSSCFSAVYLQQVLDTLDLPAGMETSDVSWTLGAVVCTVSECLETP